MERNLTEMVFILDKSGSMAGLEADTIGGFNSMIERQKHEEGEALASTVLFSKGTYSGLYAISMENPELFFCKKYLTSCFRWNKIMYSQHSRRDI